MKILNLLFYSALFLIVACQNDPWEVIEIEGSKDLIPEGIALTEDGKIIFLSSVHQKKVVAFNPVSGKIENVIDTNRFDYESGVGLQVHDGKLFAIGSKIGDAPYRSMLLVINMAKNELLHSYSLQDSAEFFLNDLAISEDNQVYLTDTYGHRIYHLDYPEGDLEVFLTHQQIQYPNGIALSADGTKLFIDSWTHGVRILDMKSKQILNPPLDSTYRHGVDGLKYHKGKLYGVKNADLDSKTHGILVYTLSEDETAITDVRYLLRDHEKMEVPTTLCIQDDYLYLIANSQLDDLDQTKNEIIHRDSLSNTYILKYKL